MLASHEFCTCHLSAAPELQTRIASYLVRMRRAPTSHAVSRSTGILGRAPAHLTSRTHGRAHREAARCGSSATNPPRPRGWLAGYGSGQNRGQELLWRQNVGDPTVWRQNKLKPQQVLNKGRPGWVDGQLGAVDVQMGPGVSSSNWTLQDDNEPDKPAGSGWGVMAETVSTLCDERLLSEAVEALGVLVQTDHCIPKSLFYTVLKKCEDDLPLGRRVHGFTVRKGYESDTFLGNHILRMYSSHGRLEDAMGVFSMVAQPDAFMWFSIISAYVKHGQDKQAIQLYHGMRRTGVQPDGHVFVAALQACGRGSDLKSGQQVHADVLASGLDPDLFVCNGLVNMYAKCGSLEDAKRVFDGLVKKDVVSWNAMISGYSQQGMGQEALRLYSTMRAEGTIVAPDSVTFLCLLQACAGVGSLALEKGRQLHVQISEGGHQADVLVANNLVNMYVKCGSLEDARRVFDGLGEKDVVTWNAMIAGYSQQGWGQKALGLYSLMQEEGMAVPNSVTFVILLQACASVGTRALERGKQLHTQVIERGFQADLFVRNSLVNMYAKWGSLEQARRVFDGLHEKDVVTWNAMIAGYSQQGMGHKALELYSYMQEGSVVPNPVTFVSLLQACASVGPFALEKGMQLHAEIRAGGHQANTLVANSLVTMYAKCGRLRDAQTVFDVLTEKDVVTWTALIAAYARQGLWQDTLGVYEAMQAEGMAVPNCVTFVGLLQACSSVGTPALELGKQLHAQIREQGHEADTFVANSLVYMYAKCGSFDEAQRMFDGLEQKDVVTWNAMIAGYSQQGMAQEALRVYRDLEEDGVASPNSVTFGCVLHACASVGTMALERGKQLHKQISDRGYEADLLVANSLINMYAKCGSLGDARRVFEGLDGKDVVTWNTIIAGHCQAGMAQEALCLYSVMEEEGITVPNSVTFVSLLQACASVGIPALEKGKQIHTQIIEQAHEADMFVANSLVNMYAKCGSLEDARRLFDGLVRKDVVTWTALIAGYSQQGMGQEALGLYTAMQQHGVTTAPDSITFLCLLQACGDMAALHLGMQIHAQIKQHGLQADAAVACGLINMYGKSGNMVDAREVFEALPERSTGAWNALIAGYSHQGNSDAAFDSFLRMEEDGIQPDGITFLGLITVCSHTGLLDKGQEYFEVMSKHYSITPTAAHYGCMVDLLGRAGHLHEALLLIRTMPVLPDAAVWHNLLGAAHKWSNAEVGRHAFDQAVTLDKNNPLPHVLMSNIYDNAQMCELAHEMQARRIRSRARKQPGQSWWTDMDGVVHSFLVAGSIPRVSNARTSSQREKVHLFRPDESVKSGLLTVDHV